MLAPVPRMMLHTKSRRELLSFSSMLILMSSPTWTNRYCHHPGHQVQRNDQKTSVGWAAVVDICTGKDSLFGFISISCIIFPFGGTRLRRTGLGDGNTGTLIG